MNQSEKRAKRLLWVNPSFLDYRIPLYGELNKLLSGNFHLIYSKERIPKRCDDKIREVLGENAHPLEKEKHIKLGDASSDFANSSLNIPIPSGLYRMIKDVRPDAILAEGFFQFTPWALIYSLIHKIPLYIAYERTAHTERNCPAWRRLYRKIIGMFVTGYLANGSLTKEYLVSQGAKPDQIQTGGMCADSENLRLLASAMTDNDKEEFAKSIGLSKVNGIRYIYVGRLIKLKGVDRLLGVWREHIQANPEDQLLIVGSGEYLEQYRDSYKDVKSIIFSGSVDYSIIYKYYAISDVFVIPTLEDNWSLVVPEAMACGLPVACSIYNGCYPELVQKDINGITFDPDDQHSIMNALAYFHNKEWSEMGEASKRIESMFNPRNTALNVLRMVKS